MPAGGLAEHSASSWVETEERVSWKGSGWKKGWLAVQGASGAKKKHAADGAADQVGRPNAPLRYAFGTPWWLYDC